MLFLGDPDSIDSYLKVVLVQVDCVLEHCPVVEPDGEGQRVHLEVRAGVLGQAGPEQAVGALGVVRQGAAAVLEEGQPRKIAGLKRVRRFPSLADALLEHDSTPIILHVLEKQLTRLKA